MQSIHRDTLVNVGQCRSNATGAWKRQFLSKSPPSIPYTSSRSDPSSFYNCLNLIKCHWTIVRLKLSKITSFKNEIQLFFRVRYDYKLNCYTQLCKLAVDGPKATGDHSIDSARINSPFFNKDSLLKSHLDKKISIGLRVIRNRTWLRAMANDRFVSNSNFEFQGST